MRNRRGPYYLALSFSPLLSDYSFNEQGIERMLTGNDYLRQNE